MCQTTITFTGDLLCDYAQQEACKTNSGYDFSSLFQRIIPHLNKADYLVGNLESPFAGEKFGYTHELYCFNSPEELAYEIKNAGFDLVSTANNHCLDRELPGLKATLDFLDSIRLDHTGTARTKEERDTPCIREINGIRFAFLSWTYGTNAFANHHFLKDEEAYAVNLFMPQETLPGSVHLLDTFDTISANITKNHVEAASEPYLRQLEADIKAARALKADFVILLMHSGGQYNLTPDPYTEFLVSKIQSFKPDLIIGNHPHVLQKTELSADVPIFWSLGNLTCTPGKKISETEADVKALGGLVTITFEKDETGTKLTAAEFIPTKSIVGENKISSVYPLYNLIQAANTEETRNQLMTDLRFAVNTMRNVSLDTPVTPAEKYTL